MKGLILNGLAFSSQAQVRLADLICLVERVAGGKR
jgi:hypothetical protein